MTAATSRRVVRSRAQTGETRRLRTRRRLLEAAAHVLADLGQERVTIDDVLAQAGVARGTFYNHFASRQELLGCLWDMVGHDPFARIQAACAPLLHPVERLAAMSRFVLRYARAEPTWGWLVVALSRDERTVHQDLRAYPLPDLHAGEALGLLHFADAAIAADLVVGTMRSALCAVLTDDRPESYPESISAMILLALGVGRAEAHRVASQALPTALRRRGSSLDRETRRGIRP